MPGAAELILGASFDSYVEPDGELACGQLPGIYVLLFMLKQDLKDTVGKLGTLEFPAGCYGYVGSGMKGAEARVRRHLRPHPGASWHLDYILPHSVPAAAILGHTSNALECSLAQSLGRDFQVYPRFGSSDCRCPGHLFRSSDLGLLAMSSLIALEGFGCATRVLPLSTEGEFLARRQSPPG